MGKRKYIETPEKMWEYFISYKKEIKEKPIIVKDWVGKDAVDVYREKERPLTLEGFENWCSDNDIIEKIIDYYEKNISQLEVLAVKSESPQSIDILKKEIDQQKTRIEDLSKSADMPVGFDKSVFSSSKITSIRDFIVLILGACLTGFAVSFGAPFWFDLLRKIYTLKKV